MPKGFTIDIRGFDKTLSNINAKSKGLKNKIAGIIEDEVQQINEEQINAAPVDMGELRQLTFFERIGDLEFGLFSKTEYAPFVEFGTRSLAIIPAGLQSYASQFKGSSGRPFSELLDFIKAWCKRKGIEASAAYPIALKIIKVGTAPQPYFFTPFFAHKAQMIERIKKEL